MAILLISTRNYSARGVLSRLGSQAAVTLAIRKRRISRRPDFPTISPDDTRKGFLDPAELDAIVAELPEWWRPVVRVAAITDWRARSEIVQMRWNQVDFQAGTLRLEPGQTKNREGRTWLASAHSELWTIIQEQSERALQFGSEFVFFRVVNGVVKPLGSYAKAWKTATRKAGLGGKLVHDLRRGAVRCANFERFGISRSVGMSLSGHKTGSIYTRYAIADLGAQRKGVAKLGKIGVNK